MNFLEKYEYMYYYLNFGNLDANVIILGIQEGVDTKETNNIDVLEMRRKGNNTDNLDDGFYYHNTQDSGGPYFNNVIHLIKGIRNSLNNNFGNKFFFTEIEPFPKPNNKTLLEDYYETDEITNELMRKHKNWDIRINKIKELLKGKIILVGSHYRNNFILNDLDIDNTTYNQGKIFIYEESLYIQVEHFSYLNIMNELEEIKKILEGNTKLNELFNKIIKINKLLGTKEV